MTVERNLDPSADWRPENASERPPERPPERLMIVDDEADMLEGLRRLLGYEMADLRIETFTDPRRAVDAARERPPDLVLLDVRMPEMDGISALKALKRDDPSATCIMLTAHGTIELAVEAIKAGAYDFLTKPFDTDVLVRTLNQGLERNRLIRENRNLRGRLEASDFHGMIGRSPAMGRLFDRLRAAARSDYSVLIRGESGTGKELAARALHDESRRSGRAFVTVNCPAIPEALLESELFGHRRGGFTGADRDRRGMFEEADGGTLFLDEIADIPVTTQTKLLRALQEGEIKPVGADKSKTVDVRIVAATNQDLEEKIRSRAFREDLFYRLNVVTLNTPALREAPEDIPLLARHYVKIASEELELPRRRFSAEALRRLSRFPWPGNVRQLQNLVRQAVMFSPDEEISAGEVAALLPEGEASGSGSDGGSEFSAGNGEVTLYREAKAQVVDRFTREYIEDLLRKTDGNVTRGAELSGLGRASLQKIMKRLDIQSEDFRGE
jgi:DNA-binding NtrC family response regulator